MGTRAATFAARVKTLLDYYYRIASNSQPLPTGTDITNTLKYFSQVLLGVLKDVPKQPLDLIRNGIRDEERLGLYPNMDYIGLYAALCNLSKLVQDVPGENLMMGESLLNVFASLLPFLDTRLIQSMPTAVAAMFSTFPDALHINVGDILCYHILPFAMAPYADRLNPGTYSSPSVLLLLLQYCSNLDMHCQVLEALMMLKCDVLRDLFSIIAHGNEVARAYAADLLFFYWPELNLTPVDRRVAAQKYQGWAVIPCQHVNCPYEEMESKHSCFDQGVSIVLGGDSPPPLYICADCCDVLKTDWPKAVFNDLVLPLETLSPTCENPDCRSADKKARPMALCFSMDCVRTKPTKKPVRYCSQCHMKKHGQGKGASHAFVTSVISGWDLSKECQSYLIEAIVSLLKDVSLTPEKRQRSRASVPNPEVPLTERHARLVEHGDFNETIITDDERLTLYKYGVYLLAALCQPEPPMRDETIGRLLGLIMHFYESTSLISEPRISSALEQLKSDFLAEWLKKVAKDRFSLVVTCLLPFPPEWAKVGGHWDMLQSNGDHVKHGITRLASLVSYDLITFEIWNHIMPYWMEAIRVDVPEEETVELKGTLVKMLDTEMSPLSFDAHQVYHFVSQRFLNAPVHVQIQALEWLLILSSLGIQIPVFNLLKMFHHGVRSLREEEGFAINRRLSLVTPTAKNNIRFEKSTQLPTKTDKDLSADCGKEDDDTDNSELICYIHMLDIISAQIKQSDIKSHGGVDNFPGPQLTSLLHLMLQTQWKGDHSCMTLAEKERKAQQQRIRRGKEGEEEEANDIVGGTEPQDCMACYLETVWHQLCYTLLSFLIAEPKIESDLLDEETLPSEPVKESVSEGSWLAEGLKPSELIVTLTEPTLLADTAGIVPFLPKVQTAMEVTVSEDVAPIMPQEHVVGAVARAVTVSEDEGATASCTVLSPTVMGGNESILHPAAVGDNATLGPGQQFWQTSVGRFKFGLADLPTQLQLIYDLMNRLPYGNDPDIVYYQVQQLRRLIIEAQSLLLAAKEHQGFLIWCQEHLFIRSFWALLTAKFSQIAAEVVPIILHCLALPSGSEVLQAILQEEFLAEDPHFRFQALEKVTVLCRFLEPHHVKGSPQVQTTLAVAVSFAVACLEDIDHMVATRAALYLDTIKDSSLRVLCWCLEMQFDMIVVDRPMILQTFHQLFNLLSEKPILSWEFFFSRFDTLFVEAQCHLDQAGDMHIPRDLRQNSVGSKQLQRKLTRAQEALSVVAEGRKILTVSGAVGKKWPYKRNMASASMYDRLQQERGSMDSRDRSFSRTASAPQMIKRKSSKFWPNLMNVGSTSNCLQGKADELSTAVLLQKNIDLDDFDKETYHLLIFLLMNFMAHAKSSTMEEKASGAKAQQLVLQHLWLMMGYLPSEKVFIVPPIKIRFSPIFNAFLSNLPAVLDRNVLLGNILAPTILTVLPFSASPQRGPTERYPPTYSLWLVDPALRHSWLTAALIFLYKYNYRAEPLAGPVQVVVRIILNTIQAQFHRCHTIPGAMVIAQQNLWTSSFAAAEQASDSTFLQPPVSPPTGFVKFMNPLAFSPPSSGLMARSTTQVQPTLTTALSQTSFLRDAEKELSVIPESPKSESPHGSSQSLLEEHVEMMLESVIEEAAVVDRVEYGGESSAEVQARLVAGDEEQGLNLDIQVVSSTTDSSDTSFSITSSLSQPFEPTIPPQERLLQIGTQAMRTPTIDDVFDSSHEDTLSPSSLFDLDSDNDTTTEGSFRVGAELIQSPMRERLLPIGIHKPQVIEASQAVVQEPSAVIMEATVLREDRNAFATVWESIIIRDAKRSSVRAVESPMRDEIAEDPTLSAATSRPEMVSDSEQIKPVGDGEVSPSSKRHDSTASSGSKRMRRQTSVGKWEGRKDFGSQPVNALGIDLEEAGLAPRRQVKSTGDDEVFTPDMKAADQGKSPLLLSVKPTITVRPSESGSDKEPIGIIPTRKTAPRIGEYGGVVARCTDCGCPLEQYSDEELALCVILLTTYVHREPSLAAPMLPEILNTVASLAWRPLFPWQVDGNTYVPGSALSVSRQALRCIFHQLQANNIFIQVFSTYNSGRRRNQFFKTIVQALTDFTELNPATPILEVLSDLNERKILPTDNLVVILANIASYYENLQLEPIGNTGPGPSTSPLAAILPPLENFFRKLTVVLSTVRVLDPLLRIMHCAFRTPGIGGIKGILEPFSKVLTYVLEMDRDGIPSSILGELLHLCHRTFTRDRDRLYLTRASVISLTQFMKLKVVHPENNVILLLHLILADAGGFMPPDVKLENANPTDFIGISSAECTRAHLGEVVEFIQDPHVIFKIKNALPSNSLYGQKLGGIVKASLAQYFALEIVRGNVRESKNVSRFLPWLSSTPSVVSQNTQREFQECVAHVRILGWVLLAALQHQVLHFMYAPLVPYPGHPLPLDCSCHIAEHIQVVLACYPEQHRTNVLHTNALISAFILCQLWTIYVEQFNSHNSPEKDFHVHAAGLLSDFWAKVTPAILQLVSHSGGLADSVSSHFLNLMESLLECNSTTLGKLLPLWSPMLEKQLCGSDLVRLQACQSAVPISSDVPGERKPVPRLLLWLQHMELRMAQTEFQSSSAEQTINQIRDRGKSMRRRPPVV